MDCLSTEPRKDSHLLKINSVNGKRRRLKKSVLENHNQEDVGASSVLENVTEKYPKRTQRENTSREPDLEEKNYQPV